ncbi:SMC-Scp complex subunit ScpB [Amycolatopsis japonica]|uniref:SMC-Scp complex subunit ScpB n=1 Tax=Amycolatopsis japonica TaxID=208439 RepID=UPI0037FADFF8
MSPENTDETETPETRDGLKAPIAESDEVKDAFVASDEVKDAFSPPEADEPGEPEAEAEPPADEGLVAAGDGDYPDVTSDEALEAALEALLLVVDSPISEESLAETVGQPVSRVTVALRTMAQKFTERTSGIDLRRVGEGWRFYTRDVYAPFVEKLLLDGQRSKLTRAALESLAVIAYRQPVTRARVAAVRGVNVDGVIRTLLARGLIEEMGTDPETTGTLYVTTELFLERLGLSSLADLPPIAPLLPEVDTIDDI